MEVSEINLADGEYTVEVTMKAAAAGWPPFSRRQNYNRKRTGGSRNRLEQFSL